MPMADEDDRAEELKAKELKAWCDAMAKLLALPTDQADSDEIIANLRVLARQMELIGDFPIDDDEDPAPQFRA
jgi:hypothetical protein